MDFDEIEYKTHWDEYDELDKLYLISHWFNYYGVNDATVGETLKFYNLVLEDIDKVFKYALEDYYNSLLGAYGILCKIRYDEKVDLNIKNNEYNEEQFINELNNSYEAIRKLQKSK